MFDAAERYQQAGLPLIVLAGKEYGSGSSRDWAAKGPFLLVRTGQRLPGEAAQNGPELGGDWGGIDAVLLFPRHHERADCDTHPACFSVDVDLFHPKATVRRRTGSGVSARLGPDGSAGVCG